ncbi:ASC-1 complex subunit p50 [Intoshia linei]|uniref:ASC-1 complex subunit p50 n=1 Tax=Intoshia linei TaxID=1819745 RepID=A0A177B2L8_9BILA|nr:ASC-1 complex subunit p50 [Intoshia linei]
MNKEILNPKIIEYNNRCYRVNPTNIDKFQLKSTNVDCNDLTDVDNLNEIFDKKESLDITSYLELLIKDQKVFFKNFINNYPVSFNFTKDKLEIFSNNETTLQSVVDQILIELQCLMSRREFLFFPKFFLIDFNLISNFIIFKERVLNLKKKINGFSPSLFISEQKLHQTLGGFYRKDCNINVPIDISKITSQIDQEIKSINLSFSGVTCLTDDPSQTHVLYMKIVDDDNFKRFKQLCEKSKILFDDDNFKEQQNDILPMFHVTLMNSLFVQSEKRQTFDAGPILKVFRNFFFGKSNISNLTI